jgi:hypothetical protein
VCGDPERLSAFGARNFPTLITSSVVQDLNEKIAGVDYPLRCMYRSRAESESADSAKNFGFFRIAITG